MSAQGIRTLPVSGAQPGGPAPRDCTARRPVPRHSLGQAVLPLMEGAWLCPHLTTCPWMVSSNSPPPFLHLCPDALTSQAGHDLLAVAVGGWSLVPQMPSTQGI